MKRGQGFTLVELIVVLVLIGVLAGMLTMAVRPLIGSYVAVSGRAGLTDQADTALRRILADVRAAVPNSVRLIAPNCIEMIPTSDGGRMRMGPDTVWDAAHPSNKSLAYDDTRLVTGFDVLTPRGAVQVNDWVVINSQNTNDVYAGVNRAQIASIDPTPDPSVGNYRINFAGAASTGKWFPPGYPGGRFVVVPGAQQAVSYVCAGAGTSAGGGSGTLYRISGYGFNATASCPTPGPASPVVATKVSSCNFSYDPTQGLTEQNGYLQLSLGLADGGESISLTAGAHVENLP